MLPGNLALLVLLGLLAIAGSLLVLPLVLLARAGRWVTAQLRRLAGRFGRRPAAPPPADELPASLLADPAPLVIAVHGTFAPGAAWTSPEQGPLYGELARALQSGAGGPMALAWHRHEWGGANTVAARHAGVRSLCAKLERVFAAQPARRVVLIGHSHGGNIALKAAESQAQRQLQVLTLATPFLIVQPRRFGLELAMMLTAINALVIATIAGVAVATMALGSAGLAGDQAPLLGWLVAVAVALPTLAHGFLRGLPAVVAEAQSLQESALDLARLEPLRARTLVCSRVGDEADGGLKLVSLLNAWLLRTIRSAELIQLMQRLSEVLREALEPDAPPTLATLRRTAFAAALQHPRLLLRLFRNIFNSATLLEMFAAWMGLLLLELLQPAVGTRHPLVGAMAAVTSSETPPGEWRHLQSLYALDDASALLSHSQIYADAALRAQACAWIAERLAAPAATDSG